MDATRRYGTEGELNAVDDDGNAKSVYHGGKPLLPHHSAELYSSTFEASGDPEPTMQGSYVSLFRKITEAYVVLRKAGGHFDPAAARMQDIPSERDISPNDYVRAIVPTLGDLIQMFIGAGVHEHFGVHAGLLPPVTGKYLRVLAPYLNIGLQAAPHAFGELTPRLGELLEQGELKHHDGDQPHSVRYLTRFATSPNGGIGLPVVHATVGEALSHADTMLRDGQISNPARHLGSHADVRSRYDAPKEDPDCAGRAELCVKDTAAYRLPTLQAYGELAAACVLQLERAALAGEKGLAWLHQDFPELFGPTLGNEIFATKQLLRTHDNSVEIAYGGADTFVIDGVGATTRAAKQLRRVQRFAEQGAPALGERTKRTINNSLVPEHVVEDIARRRESLDEHGLPTLSQFYRTGYGTAAQWMILRARAAEEMGLKGQDAMRLGTQDRSRSFGQYLGNLSKALFEDGTQRT